MLYTINDRQISPHPTSNIEFLSDILDITMAPKNGSLLVATQNGQGFTNVTLLDATDNYTEKYTIIIA